MLRRLSSRLQSCFFQQIFVLFSAPSAISFAFGSLRVLVRQLLNSRLFVCIGGQMVLGFLMPDSDQRLSVKISGEKGFDFSPCLRGGLGCLVILVLTFSVSLRDLCGKSAPVFLSVLAVISPMLCLCA